MNGGDITIRYLVPAPTKVKKKKKPPQEAVTTEFISQVDHFGFYVEEKEKMSFQQFLNSQAEILSPFFRPKDPKKEAEIHKKQVDKEVKRSIQWAPMIKEWKEAQKEQVALKLKPQLKEWKQKTQNQEKESLEAIMDKWAKDEEQRNAHELKNNPQFKAQIMEELKKNVSVVKIWNYDKKKRRKVDHFMIILTNVIRLKIE